MNKWLLYFGMNTLFVITLYGMYVGDPVYEWGALFIAWMCVMGTVPIAVTPDVVRAYIIQNAHEDGAVTTTMGMAVVDIVFDLGVVVALAVGGAPVTAGAYAWHLYLTIQCRRAGAKIPREEVLADPRVQAIIDRLK